MLKNVEENSFINYINNEGKESHSTLFSKQAFSCEYASESFLLVAVWFCVQEASASTSSSSKSKS